MTIRIPMNEKNCYVGLKTIRSNNEDGYKKGLLNEQEEIR